MSLSRLDAAHARMVAARAALGEQLKNPEREKELMRELLAATDEFIAAADALLRRDRKD